MLRHLPGEIVAVIVRRLDVPTKYALKWTCRMARKYISTIPTAFGLDATHRGYLGLLRWAVKYGWRPCHVATQTRWVRSQLYEERVDEFELAVYGGWTDVAYWIENTFWVDDRACDFAAYSSLRVLQWAARRYPLKNSDLCAASNHQVAMLTWIKERQLLDPHIYDVAIRYCTSPFYYELFDAWEVPLSHSVDTVAAMTGDTRLLDWLSSQTTLDYDAIAQIAATDGDIRLLDWVAQRHQVNLAHIANQGALKNRPHVLEWAHQRGFTPNEYFAENVVIGGPRSTEWAIQHGVRLTKRNYDTAVEIGNYRVAKRVRSLQPVLGP